MLCAPPVGSLLCASWALTRLLSRCLWCVEPPRHMRWGLPSCARSLLGLWTCSPCSAAFLCSAPLDHHCHPVVGTCTSQPPLPWLCAVPPRHRMCLHPDAWCHSGTSELCNHWDMHSSLSSIKSDPRYSLTSLFLVTSYICCIIYVGIGNGQLVDMTPGDITPIRSQ